jgi:hypothetical protein
MRNLPNLSTAKKKARNEASKNKEETNQTAPRGRSGLPVKTVMNSATSRGNNEEPLGRNA